MKKLLDLIDRIAWEIAGDTDFDFGFNLAFIGLIYLAIYVITMDLLGI